MTTEPTAPDAPRCQGKMAIYGHCFRRPTVTREGRTYCWQHDPVRLDEEWAKQRAKSKAEREAQAAKVDRWDSRRTLEEGADARDLTDDELRRLAALGGLRRVLAGAETDGRLATTPRQLLVLDAALNLYFAQHEDDPHDQAEQWPARHAPAPSGDELADLISLVANLLPS